LTAGSTVTPNAPPVLDLPTYQHWPRAPYLQWRRKCANVWRAAVPIFHACIATSRDHVLKGANAARFDRNGNIRESHTNSGCKWPTWCCVLWREIALGTRSSHSFLPWAAGQKKCRPSSCGKEWGLLWPPFLFTSKPLLYAIVRSRYRHLRIEAVASEGET